MSEQLDISSLRDALAELGRMHEYARSPAVTSDAELFSYMRTAVIKGFEYSYEMSYKTMRRFLDIYGAARPSDDELTFPALLRLSKEYNLIEDPAAWILFREKRNITSHIYRRYKADEVYAIIPEFLKQAGFLLSSLGHRIATGS